MYQCFSCRSGMYLSTQPSAKSASEFQKMRKVTLNVERINVQLVCKYSDSNFKSLTKIFFASTFFAVRQMFLYESCHDICLGNVIERGGLVSPAKAAASQSAVLRTSVRWTEMCVRSATRRVETARFAATNIVAQHAKVKDARRWLRVDETPQRVPIVVSHKAKGRIRRRFLLRWQCYHWAEIDCRRKGKALRGDSLKGVEEPISSHWFKFTFVFLKEFFPERNKLTVATVRHIEILRNIWATSFKHFSTRFYLLEKQLDWALHGRKRHLPSPKSNVETRMLSDANLQQQQKLVPAKTCGA